MTEHLAIFGAQYLYLFVVLLFLVWWYRQTNDVRLKLVVLVPIIFALIYVMRILAGSLYYDPLPLETAGFPIIIPHEPGNGFPSDHTLLCSAIAFVPTISRSRLAYVLWALTAAVALSRVYLGLHHVLDVTASALISVTVGWVVWVVLSPAFETHYKKLTSREDLWKSG